MVQEPRKRSEKAGLPPGTLIHIGERKTENVRITLTEYGETSFVERDVESLDDSFPFKGKPLVSWLNIEGIHDVALIEQLGARLSLHPLLLEDILNTEQRPKVEDYGEYLYVVVKSLAPNGGDETVKSEQVSIVLGPDFVVSLQEGQSSLYSPIRERLRTAKGRIRHMGADFLAYTLMDAIVDNYFIVLETMSDRLDVLEEKLVVNPGMKSLRLLHGMKRDMVRMMRSVWPLREVANSLQRGESALVHESTTVYLRDLYDHVVQIIDTVETLRDVVSGLIDIYLSSISNRTNEIMKVLTIIATIFIPLTFVAGVFGMNFKYMPELEWRWGYPLCLLLMFCVAMLLIIYFRRKRWI